MKSKPKYAQDLLKESEELASKLPYWYNKMPLYYNPEFKLK